MAFSSFGQAWRIFCLDAEILYGASDLHRPTQDLDGAQVPTLQSPEQSVLYAGVRPTDQQIDEAEHYAFVALTRGGGHCIFGNPSDALAP
ncbi:hypothetical protein [Sphingobium aquiterrae]|uniref:hypothetical protein n=1 Tax=Sphingobium aquiterrae TaxID=2038656 RepID=UPI0030162BE7